ncbi:hypothetical protein SLE2022_129710 [Rubroshorea leprosula]
MAPSANDASPLPTPPTDAVAENNLQPFFLLHKASSRKPERKSSGTGKSRRRIDLSPSLPKKAEKLEGNNTADDNSYMNLRMEAFEFVWSRIESTIRDVLREISTKVFSEIQKWVQQSFNAIKSSGTLDFPEATSSFPVVMDATSKQLFTGLVLTKNMEFVDDLLTFEELGNHLKSQGYHVANLSSLEFSAKNGIGGCLQSLLRQFLMATLDAADISILASWYREQANYNKPVVIIVDDIERCSGPVLSDFILMLSEWIVKIPVILIMGVATTLDAPRSILSSNALHYLCPSKFTLGTPAERMDAIVEAVLVKPGSGFSIGHKLAVFMRNYFKRQDGTLTAFIRALKIACSQHFTSEPLSFMLRGFLLEEESESEMLSIEKHGLSPDAIIKHAFDFPSCQRNKVTRRNIENLAHGLLELKQLQNHWSTVVLCLYEAGKVDKIHLLDLLVEALDPNSYNLKASDAHINQERNFILSNSSGLQHPRLKKGGVINQAVSCLRDLSLGQLAELLKRWKKLTVGITEIHDRVKELQSLLKLEDGKCLKQDLIDISKKNASKNQLNNGNSRKQHEKAIGLLEFMVSDHMQPVEGIPFHEIVCFKNVDKLQSALIGDPRRRIQVDLLEFQKLLQCSCCSGSGSALLPSMHDTSILYNLAQEHSDLINLHDWYQSFKSIALCPRSRKVNTKQSPLKKKRKSVNNSENQSEASIQARFCRAIMDLQVTGLIRMPTKRRPDFVQRVAFGL